MLSCGLKSVVSTLVDSKGYVRMGVTGKVEQHPNYTGIWKCWVSWNTTRIFGKRSGLCRCVFVLEVVSTKAKSSDDSLN
jgi:hypothetical protein